MLTKYDQNIKNIVNQEQFFAIRAIGHEANGNNKFFMPIFYFKKHVYVIIFCATKFLLQLIEIQFNCTHMTKNISEQRQFQSKANLFPHKTALVSLSYRT